SAGLSARIRLEASASAGLRALPRNAWPSMPSSVRRMRTPRLLRPEKVRAATVYRVGGMSTQSNKISSTLSIFTALLRLQLAHRPEGLEALCAPCSRAARTDEEVKITALM